MLSFFYVFRPPQLLCNVRVVTVYQPVEVYSSIKTAHMLSPNELATFLMSIYRAVLSLIRCKYISEHAPSYTLINTLHVYTVDSQI